MASGRLRVYLAIVGAAENVWIDGKPPNKIGKGAGSPLMLGRRLVLSVMLATSGVCQDDAVSLARGECPPLLPRWSRPVEGLAGHRVANVVAFRNSGITWNGQPISRGKLREYLLITRTMSPVPMTVLDPTNAPDCETAARIRDDIDESADCRDEGVCGLGSWEEWRRASSLGEQESE